MRARPGEAEIPPTLPRVYLESLGCKLNQCERDMLAQQFVQAGYRVVLEPEEADLCVVNTCAVTHVAMRKSRQSLRHLRRVNPAAHIVVTGCSTGLGENGLSADLVVTNEHKQELVALVETRWGPGERPANGSVAGHALDQRRSVRPRTRPLVKVQDGCDNACAYCIVRLLRGPQRSRPRSEIVAEVGALVEQGYNEVVLTGVHVGAYGRDIGDHLVGLVEAVLAQASPRRLRLSSIEPWDLTPDFIALWADPRLCRHLHLPLQSGCDATLQRMNRRYTCAQYADIVARVRAAIPGLAVTTDLIVGFPGETEDEFAASAAFVAEMSFARAHIFPYSERPGTPAATMPNAVHPQVRDQRAQHMTAIARQSNAAFRHRFLGHTLSVLWETRTADGRWSGLSDNYIRVFARSEQELANTLSLVCLTGLEAGGMSGEIGATCMAQERADGSQPAH